MCVPSYQCWVNGTQGEREADTNLDPLTAANGDNVEEPEKETLIDSLVGLR